MSDLVPGFNPEITQSATLAQRMAADPSATVFVEANAGSGKTRVLIDRVARLLLAGAAPDRVLCVTFTKAAAGEMQTRLFKKLGEWSTLDDEAISQKLIALTGESDGHDLANARRLFARALETPGGLRIQTLHAFCESLLRRFPLEAGLPPGFEVIDDADARKLRMEVRDEIFGEAAERPDSVIADCVNILLHSAGPDAIDKLISFSNQKRHHLLGRIEDAGNPDILLDRASLALGVDPETDEINALETCWAETVVEDIDAALSGLQSGSKAKTVESAAALAEALELGKSDPAEAMDQYIRWITTQKGEVKQPRSLYEKKLGETYKILVTLYGDEGSERHRIRDEVLPFIAAAKANQVTRGALYLAERFVTGYSDRLMARRRVEFSDLVERAKALLTDSEAKVWTLYKLDAGLDHVLVDEAQDTAPDQWAVINALTEEFFAGEGARAIDDLARSVFCVGDEKQSIYSFQDAKPVEFLNQKIRLEHGASQAGLAFESPPLRVSFRSAPEILGAVDACFASEAAALKHRESLGSDEPGLELETKFLMADPETDERRDALAFHRYDGHLAARENMPGCVEIWPVVPRPVIVEDETIELRPVDEDRPDSARNQLAEAVASEIAGIVNRGDAIWPDDPPFEPRPAKAGDILVLVRKRGGLFEELIRRLKLKNVPVAGADRMSLPDQLVVEDLLSLARFALLPEDDLSLAEVLKSPFFHSVEADCPIIDDDALLDLSQVRADRLWDKLRRIDDPRFEEAFAALDALRAQVEVEAPYGFFNRFLTGTSSTGETRLARLFARFGDEARDPVEEFLNRALAHEANGAPSLLRFVDEMDRDESDVKRELDGGRNEVRVMTVHGSKGLEAPIVFLPDTTQTPTDRSAGLFAHDRTGLIWAPDTKAPPRLVEAIKDRIELEQDGEYDRLFYVAMTRARDRLIVCGHLHGRSGDVSAGSWYDRARRSFYGENWHDIETPMDTLSAKNGWEAEPGLRFGPDPVALGKAEPDHRYEPMAYNWVGTLKEDTTQGLGFVAPSKLISDETDEAPVALSPLATGGPDRFRRGNIIHKLLQTLPDLDPDRWEISAQRYLAAQNDLDEARRAEIVSETLTVLHHDEFAPIFGAGSRAEVALSGTAPGLPDGVRVNGQIDRLVITDHEVLIIDYKTNRPPPKSPDDVSAQYVGQLAAYRAILQALEPEKTVRCALLWTDGPSLMEISSAQMEAALHG
jgi:ATP-dependent helicase/nuclease subunit A